MKILIADKFEESGIRNSDHVGIWKNVQIGEPLNPSHVLAIGSRAIHGPADALHRKKVAPAEFGAAEVLRHEAAEAARTIFRVGEASEEKFDVLVGRCIRDQKHRNQTRHPEKSQR